MTEEQFVFEGLECQPKFTEDPPGKDSPADKTNLANDAWSEVATERK